RARGASTVGVLTATLTPSWRWPPPTATAGDCASDTARFVTTCSPFSVIPRLPPTTTAANVNCGPPPPIAKSPAASAPTGALTCSPPSAPSSVPPHDAASTPIRRSITPYAANPCTHQVEQLRQLLHDEEIHVKTANFLSNEIIEYDRCKIGHQTTS